MVKGGQFHVWTGHLRLVRLFVSLIGDPGHGDDFFALSGVLPRDEAISEIKKAIEKTYSRKGAEIVETSAEAV